MLPTGSQIPHRSSFCRLSPITAPWHKYISVAVGTQMSETTLPDASSSDPPDIDRPQRFRVQQIDRTTLGFKTVLSAVEGAAENSLSGSS